MLSAKSKNLKLEQAGNLVARAKLSWARNLSRRRRILGMETVKSLDRPFAYQLLL